MARNSVVSNLTMTTKGKARPFREFGLACYRECLRISVRTKVEEELCHVEAHLEGKASE